MIAPFVGLALHVCELLEIADKRGQGMVMRFAKIYPPEKMSLIVERAKEYAWWKSNPMAAFMKSVGETNRQEKSGNLDKTV